MLPGSRWMKIPGGEAQYHHKFHRDMADGPPEDSTCSAAGPLSNARKPAFGPSPRRVLSIADMPGAEEQGARAFAAGSGTSGD
jgi:hypothetical protein